jgi:MSHA biogenesis protein MshN
MGMGISLLAEKRLPEAQEAYKRAVRSDNLSPELRNFVEQRLNQIEIEQQ